MNRQQEYLNELRENKEILKKKLHLTKDSLARIKIFDQLAEIRLREEAYDTDAITFEYYQKLTSHEMPRKEEAKATQGVLFQETWKNH